MGVVFSELHFIILALSSLLYLKTRKAAAFPSFLNLDHSFMTFLFLYYC